jgi:nuclear RNA export factor
MTARSQSPRGPPRGPAANRRGGGVRKGDRDGDVSMDVAIKGRGRIGKSTPPPNARDSTSRGGRGGRAGILSVNARSAILRSAASSDVSMKEAKTSTPRAGLIDLKITGWEKSKASSDADGGVSSLIKWMEKKASHRLGSRTREVKIKKVCYRQHFDDCCVSPCQLASTSGPLSLAANLRTTTAIQDYGQCLPYG